MDGVTLYVCWKALDRLELEILDKVKESFENGTEDFYKYIYQNVGIALAKLEIEKICKTETGKSVREWC